MSMAYSGLSSELAQMLERRRRLSETTALPIGPRPVHPRCTAPAVCSTARIQPSLGHEPQPSPESPPSSAGGICARIHTGPPGTVVPVVTRRTISTFGGNSPIAEPRPLLLPECFDNGICRRKICQAQIEELRAQAAALRSQIDREGAAQKEEAAALRTEREELIAAGAELGRRLKSMQSEVASLRKQQEWTTLAGQQKANLLQAEVSVLHKQLESAARVGQQKVEALRAERDAASETIEDLRSQASALNAEIGGLRGQVEDMSRHAKTLLAARDEALASAEDLRKYVWESQAETAALRGQLEDVSASGQQLAERLRAERDAATDAVDKLRLSEGGLRADVRRLEAELSEERERARRLEAQAYDRTATPSEAPTLAGSDAGDGAAADAGVPPPRAPPPPAALRTSSEGALRAALARPGASSAEELRCAVGSVSALLEEAQRELRTREVRERRAAYERLHAAVVGEDEEALASAIAEAARTGADAADIKKAAAKLEALALMTPAEREARWRERLSAESKREAFILVRRGAGAALAELLDGLGPEADWRSWRNSAGSSLATFAAQHGSLEVQAILRSRLEAAGGTPCTATSTVASSSDLALAPEADSPKAAARRAAAKVAAPPPASTEAEEKMRNCFKAIVQDDVSQLAELLEGVPIDAWARWRNRAGRDLVSLAEERGAAGTYAMLARALGIIEDRQQSPLEEGEHVWVFIPGEVQPRRATVVERGREDAEPVLLEFWEGSSPAHRMPRASVFKTG